MCKKNKKTVQNTPGNIIAVNGGVLMLAEVPGAGERRKGKKPIGEFNREGGNI